MIKRYNSIFDVIRELEPNSLYLRAYEYHKQTALYSVRTPDDSFQWIELPDGTKGAISTNYFSWKYYRGENEEFEKCLSSRDRLSKTDEKIIADIKVIEFELALKQFPRILLAEKEGRFIDYIGLAQHYGLKTNYLDLTNDIGVAALFACAKFNERDGIISTIESGCGQIRVKAMPIPDNPCDPKTKLRFLGKQPLIRPGKQIASCFRLDEGEDFAKECDTYVFNINPGDAEIIFASFLELVGKGPSYRLWLFPCENRIVPIADEIKNKKCVTNKAIELYCSRFNKNIAEVKTILDLNSYSIIYSDVQWISTEEKAKMEKDLATNQCEEDFAGVRLCYRPVNENNVK